MKALLCSAAVVFASTSVCLAAVDCASLMRMHGMLSRAQSQCHYAKYSQQLVAMARQCSHKMSSGDVQNSLRSGMTTFDLSEKRFGHKKTCNNVLRDYPKLVVN